MNKQSILNTAVWTRDAQDGSFVVESPLLEDVIGAGLTKEEAWNSFIIFVNDAYIEYLEGSFGKRGRPSKGNVEIHVQVKSSSKEALKALSENLGVSQGECIDFLVAYFKGQQSNPVIDKKSKAKIPGINRAQILRQAKSGKLIAPIAQAKRKQRAQRMIASNNKKRAAR
jgi:hypothetical protein